jgi:Antitoxin VbhA
VTKGAQFARRDASIQYKRGRIRRRPRIGRHRRNAERQRSVGEVSPLRTQRTSLQLEGWRPTRESVALLIDAVAGNITADEYRARVVASAATRGRQFGQLPTISVPDDFDDPLPDAEIVAWEGKPRD